MIIYTDIKRYDNLSFADYQLMDPLSNSYLKHEVNGEPRTFEANASMKIGSLVDGILTAPDTVNMRDEFYQIAKDFAHNIKMEFGMLIKEFNKQVSFTANAWTAGCMLKVKGRPDFCIEKFVVTDLKITKSTDIMGLIKYMRYEDQVWHYCKLARAPQGYLMVYSIPLRKTHIIKVDVSKETNTFYQGKIMRLGNYKSQ